MSVLVGACLWGEPPDSALARCIWAEYQAWLPASDLAQPELLREHLKISLEARKAFGWAREVPEDVFVRYVAWPRVSQEPLEPWRRIFLDSLRPAVESLSSLERVAVELNRWCDERIDYKPTQRRDQGPLETWRSGFGRCEEMTIFYISAARSVGVPAREAYTPWWPFTESNHAWTEVWTPEGWKYLGSCEFCDSLNCAWFSEPVKRAAIVLAVAPGRVEGDSVYRRGADFSLVNVTEHYRKTGVLKVKLTQGKEPASGKEVFVYVFNWGALRPVARFVTDERGEASLEMGLGDYFISWGKSGLAKVSVREGVNEYELDLDEKSKPLRETWLRYPR